MTLTKSKALIFLISAALSLVAAEAPPYQKLLASSRQALLVTTDGWNSVNGTVRYFERSGKDWRQIGGNIPIVVGKNGLAWDATARSSQLHPEFIKHEGDGRSPAGIFRLNPQFGFAASASNQAMRYVPLTPQTECVDDPNSRFYNQIVSRAHIAQPDWNSSEKMREIDPYKIGMVVAYNPAHTKGLGSCVFLHIWRGPDHGTAGCTAMDETALQKLLQGLDEKQHPVLIQLPAAVYETLRAPWHLP